MIFLTFILNILECSLILAYLPLFFKKESLIYNGKTSQNSAFLHQSSVAIFLFFCSWGMLDDPGTTWTQILLCQV